MIKHNYHTHTTYCQHAINTPREIVELAIKSGLETIGFSEHMRLKGDPSTFRILTDKDEQDYINDINELKKEFKDKIRILCGFECEGISGHNGKDVSDYSGSKLDIEGVDYLILSNHFYPSKGHVYSSKASMKDANKWLEVMKKAWLSGKFKYMAHPDGFAHAYKDGWDNVAEHLAEEIVKFSAKNNMPLGFNLNGMNSGALFPSKRFFKIAKKYNAPVIMELDAHSHKTFSLSVWQKGMKVIEELGLNLIQKLDI